MVMTSAFILNTYKIQCQSLCW